MNKYKWFNVTSFFLVFLAISWVSNRPLWCLKMLEKGVTATVGAVYEPYVQGGVLHKRKN